MDAAEPPVRLRAKRLPLLRRRDPEAEENGFILPANPNRRISRPLRAIRRGIIIAIWTIVACVVQPILLLIPGHAKVSFPRIYWSVMCRILGLRVRSIGQQAGHGPTRGEKRPVVFVSNHSSWLDILVLGGQLEACFISKEEVEGWPVIGFVAKLGRTVFVRRTRASTGRERDDMRARLRDGDNLILFPEGTTSDGSRVMPFRSAFLSIAELPATADGLPPIVQPVSVVYDRLGYLPAGRSTRPLFAWYGDMDIGSHFWRLAQFRGLRATVLLHPPLEPRDFANRKALSAATWAAVAEGAATLRQNRPVRARAAAGPVGGGPVGGGPVEGRSAGDGGPTLAAQT